jgi:Tol biopolymer transport system component
MFAKTSIVLTALVAVAAVSVLIVDNEAHAAFPGGNGKIAFGDGYNDVVYSVDPDGSDLTLLASGGNPAWSPGGARIAFDRDVPGAGREIFVMNSDGSSQVRLTNNAFADDSPAWSPDGAKIVFVSARDGNRELYVMNVDGSGQTRITTTAASEGSPALSPDGTTIAFTRSAGTVTDLYLADANGGGEMQLAASAGAPVDWAPDGSKLVFSTAEQTCGGFGCTVLVDLQVVNADGSGRTVISGDKFAPAWSPDGTRIAAAKFLDQGVHTIDPDGANEVLVHDVASAWEFALDWQPLCTTCQPVGGVSILPGVKEDDGLPSATWIATSLFVVVVLLVASRLRQRRSGGR